MSVVRNIANLILVLTCLTTSQYLSFLFLAMRSATLFTNRLHSLDMPPDVRNTAGVKVAFFTFNTPSTHPSSPSRSFRKLLEGFLSCLISNWSVKPLCQERSYQMESKLL